MMSNKYKYIMILTVMAYLRVQSYFISADQSWTSHILYKVIKSGFSALQQISCTQ